MPSPQRPRLFSLNYSPWSEKARWALAHHGIVYDRIAYQPLVDEPLLRLRTGKLRGRLSVPVLHDGTGWLLDSFDIARWADRVGTGAKLIPLGSLTRVEHFNGLSEQGLAAGRALGLTRMLGQPRWLASMLPPAARKSLGSAGPRLARAAIERTLRKYDAASRSLDEHLAMLRGVLLQLRDALDLSTARDGVPTLLHAFSYADISAAQVVQFVAPKNLGHFKLDAEGLAGYREPSLAAEFDDLVQWRDALYAAHRPAVAAPKKRGRRRR